MTMSIPTIYLDDPSEAHAVEALRKACSDVGFFYLEGHGLDDAYFEQVLTASKSLFDLPLSEKQILSDKVMSRGYTGMEEETLDPARQSRGDTKEGFYIGRHVPKDSPKYNPSKLSGPNQFPDSRSCPSMENPAQFKAIMEDYFDKLSNIGLSLIQLLALAIKLEDRHFFDKYFVEPLAALRLLHYAAVASNPEEGTYACGAHSDYGMLTLLWTDKNDGLQIFSRDNEWINVPPKPGALIVNLGDMLERWTNGMFKSTLHRVLTCGDKERYSIPFFYEPNFDTKVECLSVCCSEDNPPKYPPTTSGRHLLDKYAQTHAGFSPDAA